MRCGISKKMVQYLDNNNKSYTAYWSEYAEGIIRALELKK